MLNSLSPIEHLAKQFSIPSTPNTPAAHNMHFPGIVTIMTVLVMAGLTVAVSHRWSAKSTMIC
jgi:hypothetical protein